MRSEFVHAGCSKKLRTKKPLWVCLNFRARCDSLPPSSPLSQHKIQVVVLVLNISPFGGDSAIPLLWGSTLLASHSPAYPGRPHSHSIQNEDVPCSTVHRGGGRRKGWQGPLHCTQQPEPWEVISRLLVHALSIPFTCDPFLTPWGFMWEPEIL